VLGSAAVAGACPALGRKRRHHRGPDRDVRAGVEQICGRSVESGRPGDRNGHQAQRRPATLLRNRCCELQHFLSRRQIVVGRQGDVVAEEERVGIRHLADERLDETVVGVEAAGEDDRQEVHSGLATVRPETGTGPKYRESRLEATGVATKAVPARTGPQKANVGNGRPTES
jgi:hypothetical protein